MQVTKYLASIICAIIVVVLSACSPKEQAEADIMRMRVQPTATAAAIANEAQAQRNAILVPVEATLEAGRIAHRQEQDQREEDQRQALQHTGEIWAQTLSNTLRLQTMDEQHATNLQEIAAEGAAKVAGSNAEAVQASSAAVRDAGVNLAIAVGALILLGGTALGMALWAGNRATIFHDESGRMVIVKGGTIMLPSRTEGPVLVVRNPSAPERLAAGARLLLGKPVDLSPQVFMPVGPHQEAVTQRDQTIDLIRAALTSGTPNPQMQRAATEAVAQVFGSATGGMLSGRLPEQTILIDAPDQVRAFEQSMAQCAGGEE
jgi:hypothetical protein